MLTIPTEPWDSPNNIRLYGAQLLRTEEAEVGRTEAGQHVQGGPVQLALSHQIAGDQGSHLWEEVREVPWGRERCIPPGLHKLTPCAALPIAGHLSIHVMPFADFKQRFHSLQGCHIPLVDVLRGDLKEEVTQLPDQGLGVSLWVELPGEVTMRGIAIPRQPGKAAAQQAGRSPSHKLPRPICA